MRKFGLIALALAWCLSISTGSARAEEVDTSGGYEAPPQAEEDPTHRSGWFLGSDQGVLIFTGNGGNFFNLQYYSNIFGGYNFKGLFQPMVRLGQAIGSAELFFNPTTFFFIFEAGVRITPIRYKVRPYFIGTAGLYYLDFDDFGFPIREGANFTYTGGGGIEILFGSHNGITIGGEFRGFVNDGLDFYGVTVSLGYTFQF